jgi:Na+/H+-dicarboxylate symporter
MLELKSLTSYSKHLQSFIERRLWLKVILAIFLGFGIGLLLSPDFNYIPESNSKIIGSWLGLPGTLFMKLVQMIMVPLIIASIIRGLVSSNIESLKKQALQCWYISYSLLYFPFH